MQAEMLKGHLDIEAWCSEAREELKESVRGRGQGGRSGEAGVHECTSTAPVLFSAVLVSEAGKDSRNRCSNV